MCFRILYDCSREHKENMARVRLQHTYDKHIPEKMATPSGTLRTAELKPPLCGGVCGVGCVCVCVVWVCVVCERESVVWWGGVCGGVVWVWCGVCEREVSEWGCVWVVCWCGVCVGVCVGCV